MGDDRLVAARPYTPFDAAADYRWSMDGCLREDGVRAVLASRGIDVPAGAWPVHGLSTRKNPMHLEMLAARGVRAVPGTAELLGRPPAGRAPPALVTASRNAGAILAAAATAEVCAADPRVRSRGGARTETVKA